MVFFMFKTRFSYLHKIRWNCGQFPLFLSPPHSSDLISQTKYLPAIRPSYVLYIIIALSKNYTSVGGRLYPRKGRLSLKGSSSLKDFQIR